MAEASDVDVLICGAGSAGLTLAIDLARRAVSFRLIDKITVPFPGSRGKGIQPRTQEIFEDFGILERVIAVGGLYPQQRTYKQEGYEDSPVVEGNHPTPAEPHQLALMVPQFLTERVMRERLLEFGFPVEFGHELVGFAQDADGVTAQVAGPAGEEVIRARYLVGADGGRSFVRHSLNIGFPGKALGVRGLVADMNMTGLSRDVWHRFGEGDMERQIGLCPLAGTDMFQLQAPVPLEGDIDTTPAGLTRMIADRTGRSDVHVEFVSWASVFTLSARLADHYRVGKVLLAGDAAHTHPPTGAQGLNTSIQDAYNLAWKLSAVLHGAPGVLLDTYEEERRPIAAEMLGLSTSILKAMTRGLHRRGREVSQLDLGYPKSSIALDMRNRRSGLKAGYRAPDAPVRGLSDQPVRLFELFKGPHWTLLGDQVDRLSFPASPNVQVHSFGAGGDLVDHAGHFHAAYGLRAGEWALIRPDGYIGAIVPASQIAQLKSYMRSVGLAGEV